MSESISQGNLTAAIDAVFTKLAQRSEMSNAAPVEPKTLAEAHKALAESEARYQAAISKVFDALTLKSPEPSSKLMSADPDLPADFQPKSAGRGSGRRLIEVQPHWSR